MEEGSRGAGFRAVCLSSAKDGEGHPLVHAPFMSFDDAVASSPPSHDTSRIRRVGQVGWGRTPLGVCASRTQEG